MKTECHNHMISTGLMMVRLVISIKHPMIHFLICSLIIVGYRPRTNTAQALDQITEAKKKLAQTKYVKCDDNILGHNQEIIDDSELFVRKDYKKDINKPKTSMLAHQLEKFPDMPQNKFIKYSIYDGTSQLAFLTRTIRIFVVSLPEEFRNYPLKMCVLASAKIEEFIGFILYRCTVEYPNEEFEDSLHYGLFITDETGEPDLDFPPLDTSEQVQRFQFSHLALAKRKVSQFAQRTLSVTSDTGTGSLETPVDDGRKRIDDGRMGQHELMIEAPIYKSYRVFLVSKKHFKSEVQIGISDDKIEIDPLQQKNTNYFFKQKAIHYSMDSVAWSEITSKKSSRYEFKVAHNPSFIDQLTRPPSSTNQSQASPGSQWSSGPSSTSLMEALTPTSFSLKIQTFESDPITAEEIVQKINNILQIRSSSIRRDFLNRNEKIKKSFKKKKLAI